MNVKNVMKLIKPLYPKPDLSKPRLVTIGLSHFSEKARWALDLSPLKYEYYEEMHCPVMHLTTTLIELSRTPRIRTWEEESFFQQAIDKRHPPNISKYKNLTGVPKLVLPKAFLEKFSIDSCSTDPIAVVSGGSAGIVRLLTDILPKDIGYLYPIGEIDKLVISTEEYIDTHLGPAATSWAFGNMILTGHSFLIDSAEDVQKSQDFNQKSLDFMFLNISKSKIPAIEKFLFSLFGKRAAPLMIRFNNVSAQSREEAKAQISNVFQRMDELLEKNNQSCSVKDSFLLGTDRITAADITFSALALPVLMPNKCEPFFTTKDQLTAFSNNYDAPGCANMVSFSNELMNKFKSARYAVELYDHHRPELNR